MTNEIFDWLTNMLFSKKRIDHNPMYMCMMFWDLFAGTFAIFVGLPDIAMTRMTHYSTNLITWLMFAGGLFCVTGILLGTKLDPGYWIRPFINKTNIIDIRLPYILAILGTPMLLVSFFFYSIAILFQMPWVSTQASEASLAFMFGVGCTINCLRFIVEVHNINIKLPVLVDQEISMRVSEIGG